MNIKKCRIISIIGIFILSFISHYMFRLFPNIITSLIFPVNESIWEHMKILYSSIIIYGIIDYIIMNKFNIKYNNLLLELFITSYLSIIIYLIVYIPLYLLFGENLYISIILMLIVYIITKLVGYFILIKKEYKYLNIISIFLILIGYIVFIYFTYNPINSYIFYDIVNKCYGIVVN